MKKHFIYWMALGFLVITGCQKELSFEQGFTPAVGSLQSDLTGDCLPKTVNGTYVAGTALVPATNTISIQVDVTRTGSYTIITDTVNGYYFRATGIFTALGINTVTLRSNGTPFSDGINNFKVNYNGVFCDIAVTVLPTGAGGPAEFTLDGATTTPGSGCTGAIVNGSYATTIPLSASNIVTIKVNVTKIGTYTISTTFQGMKFEASGAFIAAVPQTVTLNGSGTPTTAGLNEVPIKVGVNTCTFPVTVASPAVGTLGGAGGTCTPSTPSGSYIKDVALTAANTVQVQIDVLTAGVYSVTTNTVAGFHFSGTGTVGVGPGQLITLSGGGTPNASGPQTFDVTFGTSKCTFTVSVSAPPTIDWKFTEGATTYQGGSTSAFYDVTTLAPFSDLTYEGDNTAGDYFALDLLDISGGIKNGEDYKANASTFPPENKLLDFYFENAAGTITYASDFTNGTNLKVNVSSHVTATKTVKGTFTGTVLDITGATKTITNGSFTIVYP